jgi:hypothetical protein
MMATETFERLLLKALEAEAKAREAVAKAEVLMKSFLCMVVYRFISYWFIAYAVNTGNHK